MIFYFRDNPDDVTGSPPYSSSTAVPPYSSGTSVPPYSSSTAVPPYSSSTGPPYTSSGPAAGGLDPYKSTAAIDIPRTSQPPSSANQDSK